MTDFRQLAAQLTPVAARAGRAILELYRRPVPVDWKADDSPVTEADRRAEEIILDALARAFPDVPVVAEEASVANGPSAHGKEQFFLVDPLDGTKEFIRQFDDFTVNIALIEDGAARFGIVYAPARRLLYVTLAANETIELDMCASDGASADFAGGKRLRTRSRPSSGLTAIVSRSHLNPQTEAFLAGLNIAGSASAGSSLKFAVLARGDADVYPRLSPTMEWDTAAGHAILSAAGGIVVTEAGEPLTYGKVGDGFRNPGFIAWSAFG